MDHRLEPDVWSELSALARYARGREDDEPSADVCLHLPAAECDHAVFRCAECCPHDT